MFNLEEVLQYILFPTATSLENGSNLSATAIDYVVLWSRFLTRAEGSSGSAPRIVRRDLEDFTVHTSIFIVDRPKSQLLVHQNVDQTSPLHLHH